MQPGGPFLRAMSAQGEAPIGAEGVGSVTLQKRLRIAGALAPSRKARGGRLAAEGPEKHSESRPLREHDLHSMERGGQESSCVTHNTGLL